MPGQSPWTSYRTYAGDVHCRWQTRWLHPLVWGHRRDYCGHATTWGAGVARPPVSRFVRGDGATPNYTRSTRYAMAQVSGARGHGAHVQSTKKNRRRKWGGPGRPCRPCSDGLVDLTPCATILCASSLVCPFPPWPPLCTQPPALIWELLQDKHMEEMQN